ncbi:MAG: hypothetical protein B7Z52_03150, partial [Burkholderiales bacterium 12-64-5]
RPDYSVQVVTKTTTAAISLLTAVVLWRLIPDALKVPRVSELQTAIARLEAEVGRRLDAEDHLASVQMAMASTLASVGAGFIATDRTGAITSLNAVAEEALGKVCRAASSAALRAQLRHDRD